MCFTTIECLLVCLVVLGFVLELFVFDCSSYYYPLVTRGAQGVMVENVFRGHARKPALKRAKSQQYSLLPTQRTRTLPLTTRTHPLLSLTHSSTTTVVSSTLICGEYHTSLVVIHRRRVGFIGLIASRRRDS